MTSADLIALRKTLGLSQTDMGRGMGLSLRSYQEIESTEGDLKTRHRLGAERFALDVAVDRGEPMLAPGAVRAKALDLARLIRGE